MQTNIVPFTFETSEIRVIDRAGEPWFVLADVCRVLELSNPSKAAQALDDDEKGLTQSYTPGGAQSLLIINEPGMYRLVMRSDKPAARRFQKWVVAEVLPSIRKTGAYMAAMSPAELFAVQVQINLDVERRQKEIQAAQALMLTRQDELAAQQERTAATSAEALEVARIAEAKAQATAMACQDYSIMAYARLNDVTLTLGDAQKLGQSCAAVSRERGLPIGKARDPRFGQVNTYIETVLTEVFEKYYAELDL